MMRGGLVLLVLGLAACALAAPQFNDAEAVERAEWEPLFRLLKQADEGAIEPDDNLVKVCSGWSAQELCSTIFGSGLSEETAWNEDVGYMPRALVTYEVDYDNRRVEVWCKYKNPLNQSYVSIFRDGIGCTLVEELTEEEVRAQDLGDMTPPEPLDPTVAWPVGEGFFPEDAPVGIDLDCLANVSAVQFSQKIPNARAIAVVYKGQLVFEEYAPGITKDTRLIGWSATKSITQALLSLVVGDGLLDIYEPAPVPEWYEEENDPRQNITVDMMLRMSSGTTWVGDIIPTTECLFFSNNNCGRVCGLKPLEAEPDTLWNYNSGSSYLLSRMVMSTRGDPQWTNYEWPKQRLFYPIGAHSMYIEYQPNGNFLGGAYGYATARDWARFGLLFQRDGVWVDGKRILPEGWVDYSSTATHTHEGYAAHFWRNSNIDPKLFIALGFRNQRVYIFPDQELVVVRLAMPPLVAEYEWNEGAFYEGFLSCLARP